MKNKPFSIVVLVASGIACVAMYVSLLIFGGSHQTLPAFAMVFGIACLPSILLALIAVGVRMSKPGNWVFCATSVLLIGLAILSVGSQTFDVNDMKGLGLFFILLFQFLAMLLIFVLTSIVEAFVYAVRKKSSRHEMA
jgi:hypothetical protein